MATGPRLTALAAVVLASIPVVFLPASDGRWLVFFVGVFGVFFLGAGLIRGSRRLVHLGVSGLVLRLGLYIALSGTVQPVLWVQAGIIGAVIELTALSFTWRGWPVDIGAELTRIVAMVVGLVLATSLLEVLGAGLQAAGVLGRVAGMVGLLGAAGLVTHLVRRRAEVVE